MSPREGPSEWERPSPRQEAGPDHRNSTFRPSVYPRRRQHGGSYGGGLCMRRHAANRSEPLACGCRDPWRYPPPGARGYEAAALHLLKHGLLPAFNREGLQAMRNRRAAQRITQAWELVA